MTSLPGHSTSVWIDRAAPSRYSPFSGSLSVDVAVVGGGTAGLTAAALLKRSGRRVAVLEARRVGRQVTARSNAKITTQHSLIYADLIGRLGVDAARVYADANRGAMLRIEDFIRECDIDCGFEPADAYTFTCRPDRVAEIEAEVEAATRIGLPASFVDRTSLPYGIAGGVRFERQAQFDPYRYLLALAQTLPGDGSHVFEETRVLKVEEGEPCRIETEGGTVLAHDVVVATNLPVVPEGEFHKKTSPRGHLVLGARIDPARAPDGMFLCIDRPTHSVRTTPYDGGRLLIVVGESFAPGHVRDTVALYRELERFVRNRFDVGDILYRWANEDYDSQDRLPFIGPATRDSRHLYVATGFSSWGIPNGTLAGMILSDQLAGRVNGWAFLFDAARTPGQAPGNGSPPMRRDADETLVRRLPSVASLSPGEAATFGTDEDPVGVYRDEDGRLHAVSLQCTHLGCKLTWNTAERTWDCHCHGSTFQPDGNVIHGPAVASLPPREIPGD